MSSFLCSCFWPSRPKIPEEYLRPQGLYSLERVDLKKLRRLIRNQQLAPCHPGVEEPGPGEDLEECPICFLHYPVLNSSLCCQKRVCTECFLQVQTSTPPHQLSACPFCKVMRPTGYLVKLIGARTAEEKEQDRVEEQKVIEARIREREEEMRRDQERALQRQQQQQEQQAAGPADAANSGADAGVMAAAAAAASPLEAVGAAAAAARRHGGARGSSTTPASTPDGAAAAAAASAQNNLHSSSVGAGGRSHASGHQDRDRDRDRERDRERERERERRSALAAGLAAAAAAGTGAAAAPAAGGGGGGGYNTAAARRSAASGGGGGTHRGHPGSHYHQYHQHQRGNEQYNERYGGYEPSDAVDGPEAGNPPAYVGGGGGGHHRARQGGGGRRYRLTDYVPAGVVDIAMGLDDINDLMLEQAMYESLAAAAAANGSQQAAPQHPQPHPPQQAPSGHTRIGHYHATTPAVPAATTAASHRQGAQQRVAATIPAEGVDEELAAALAASVSGNAGAGAGEVGSAQAAAVAGVRERQQAGAPSPPAPVATGRSSHSLRPEASPRGPARAAPPPPAGLRGTPVSPTTSRSPLLTARTVAAPASPSGAFIEMTTPAPLTPSASAPVPSSPQPGSPAPSPAPLARQPTRGASGTVQPPGPAGAEASSPGLAAAVVAASTAMLSPKHSLQAGAAGGRPAALPDSDEDDDPFAHPAAAAASVAAAAPRRSVSDRAGGASGPVNAAAASSGRLRGAWGEEAEEEEEESDALVSRRGGTPSRAPAPLIGPRGPVAEAELDQYSEPLHGWQLPAITSAAALSRGVAVAAGPPAIATAIGLAAAGLSPRHASSGSGTTQGATDDSLPGMTMTAEAALRPEPPAAAPRPLDAEPALPTAVVAAPSRAGPVRVVSASRLLTGPGPGPEPQQLVSPISTVLNARSATGVAAGLGPLISCGTTPTTLSPVPSVGGAVLAGLAAAASELSSTVTALGAAGGRDDCSEAGCGAAEEQPHHMTNPLYDVWSNSSSTTTGASKRASVDMLQPGDAGLGSAAANGHTLGAVRRFSRGSSAGGRGGPPGAPGFSGGWAVAAAAAVADADAAAAVEPELSGVCDVTAVQRCSNGSVRSSRSSPNDASAASAAAEAAAAVAALEPAGSVALREQQGKAQQRLSMVRASRGALAAAAAAAEGGGAGSRTSSPSVVSPSRPPLLDLTEGGAGAVLGGQPAQHPSAAATPTATAAATVAAGTPGGAATPSPRLGLPPLGGSL